MTMEITYTVRVTGRDAVQETFKDAINNFDNATLVETDTEPNEPDEQLNNHKYIATLNLTENANVNDIEQLISERIEREHSLVAQSNENGSYDIFIHNSLTR